VLDEPTSALDMRSETLIQETLLALKGTLTLFIVAHRMTTLALCDRVLVLDGGRVQAFGTREELLATSAFFAEVTRLARLPV
jgi:ABC-type multidrug transport system fused ATPase/permease subunit